MQLTTCLYAHMTESEIVSFPLGLSEGILGNVMYDTAVILISAVKIFNLSLI